MSKRTYNLELIKIMSLFEKITRTKLKDAFIDDNDLLTFVVDQSRIGKAIGKNASNVKKIESLLKRKIKIVAFNPSPEIFTKNLIYPVQADVELDNRTINIKAKDSKTKGHLIGRNQSNIKNNLKIITKYFKDIENIKVI